MAYCTYWTGIWAKLSLWCTAVNSVSLTCYFYIPAFFIIVITFLSDNMLFFKMCIPQCTYYLIMDLSIFLTFLLAISSSEFYGPWFLFKDILIWGHCFQLIPVHSRNIERFSLWYGPSDTSKCAFTLFVTDRTHKWTL